jgi:glycosyltransferase involved in cell wall biosynthesis
MFIKSNDVEYGSNRIIKSKTKLRYIYKLHEVITPKNNKNVIIPMNHGFIFDHRGDYMEKRTMDRKNYDLKILHEMVEEEPDDSRALYYLGQTYNLLEKYELAVEFYIKRVEHKDEGFIQEKIDACFEAARMCNFKLNRPWSECEILYKRAYEMDKSRPDSLYFLGIHYYLEKDYENAYKYMKEGFILGYPSHCQYGLKPTLSFYFLPKFLAEISFMFNDINLGNACCELFLSKNEENNCEFNDYYMMICWNKIYKNILILQEEQKLNKLSYKPYKPYLVFLIVGSPDPWTGHDIESNGLGASETLIIELARYIQKSREFNVVVFCNCKENDIYEGVEYRMLQEYSSFILTNEIHTCVISRCPEYLAMTCLSNNVLNVYLLLHELIREGELITRNDKLRNILCLSDWHCEYFKSIFPDFNDLVIPLGHGVDFNLFNKPKQKQKYKFIYSSFPIKGLLPLLQMWPVIHNKYPSAELYIHCDLDNKWANSVRPDEIKQIKQLLSDYPHGIFYEGLTSKNRLAQNWLSTDIWLYPCTFLETFCLSSVEAAITNTFVITSDSAVLKSTVGDRGILIQGNPYTPEWQEEALKQLFSIIDDDELKKIYLKKNYEWASELSWQNRAQFLIEIMNKNKIKIFLDE